MPFKKRHVQTVTLLSSPSASLNEEKDGDSLQSSENHNQEQPENHGCDSEGCYHSSDEEGENEFIAVNLAEMHKEVQCPICLGIIRKTRTVMECLHRFCRDCIDKSMRIGNNECPACRTHCASRRSLRDDPNYDALIAALYPDIDKYEEEELTFQDEEIARNKQIQDSIAEAFRRQAEVTGRKRLARGKKPVNYRNVKGETSHHHGANEEEMANVHDDSKNSSSTDNSSPKAKSQQYTRLGGPGTSRPSPQNDTELLAWGGGGMRSATRHAGPSSTSNKPSNSNRTEGLTEHIKSADGDKKNVRINLLLVTLDEEKIPKLEIRYCSCSPSTDVRYLCQEVAKQTSTDASNIEMLLVKNYRPVHKDSVRQIDSGVVDPSRYELLLLDEHVTVEGIHTAFQEPNLTLGYRPKARAGGSS